MICLIKATLLNASTGMDVLEFSKNKIIIISHDDQQLAIRFIIERVILRNLRLIDDRCTLHFFAMQHTFIEVILQKMNN